MTDSEVYEGPEGEEAWHLSTPALQSHNFPNFLLNSFLNFFQKHCMLFLQYSIYSHFLACMLEAAGTVCCWTYEQLETLKSLKH